VAYVFVQSGTTWTQQAELTANDGALNDLFGSSVSVSGGTALVGAPSHQVGATFEQGAAYVFVQNGTTWTQQAELTASDGAAYDMFGSSVSVGGGTALVGAPGDSSGTYAGAAYVFVQSGTTWTQQAELTASNGGPSDELGASVSLSGGTALIGAPGPFAGEPGAAYVFVQSGTTWTQQAELTASDGAIGYAFGNSVSVSGGTALVGAFQHQVGANFEQGAAYVFVQNGTMWTQQAELTASDGAAGAGFGSSVSVSGGTALVGANHEPVGANASQGAAYVFVQSGTTWTQQAELTASDGTAYDRFGTSVSVNGSTALVGAQGQQDAAYVFVPGSAGGTGSSSSSGTGGAPATTTGSSSSSGTGGAPATTTGTGAGGSTGTGESGGGSGSGGSGSGCGCRVAGEPTPHDRCLLAAVVAMAMVAGLRRRPRPGAC
jgi:MYXO-CTERM domain-containing protein